MTPSFAQRCHMRTRGVRGRRRGDHRASQRPRADSEPEPSHHEFTSITSARTAARERTSRQNKSGRPGSRYIRHVALAPRAGAQCRRRGRLAGPARQSLRSAPQRHRSYGRSIWRSRIVLWCAQGGIIGQVEAELGVSCGARLSFLDALSAQLVNQRHISRHTDSPRPPNLVAENCDRLT